MIFVSPSGAAAGSPLPLVDQDCSSNPNYPAAAKGYRIRVTVAGKIGGASGKVVEAGDVVEAVAANAGGTEAAVGTSWIVLQANIAGMTAAGLSMITAADAAAQALLLGSLGGLGVADSGKLVIFSASGAVQAAQLAAINSGDASQIGYLDFNGLTFADYAASGFDHIIVAATPTASRTHTLPDRSGTLLHADGSGLSLTGVALLGTANVFTALQTITQGTANAGILASTGYSLTGSDATSAINLSGTLNTSGNPAVMSLAVTTTAAGATAAIFQCLGTTTGTANIFSVLAPVTNAQATAALKIGDSCFVGEYTSSSLWFGTSNNKFASVFAIDYQGLSVNKNSQIGFGGDTFANSSRDAFFMRKAASAIQMGQDAAGVTNQMLTAASRITSDGVGANLTIAGGNGRGAAGGSLILSYYTTAGAATIGTLTEAMRINTLGQIILTDLPTSDPGVVGALYRTAGAVMISV